MRRALGRLPAVGEARHPAPLTQHVEQEGTITATADSYGTGTAAYSINASVLYTYPEAE